MYVYYIYGLEYGYVYVYKALKTGYYILSKLCKKRWIPICYSDGKIGGPWWKNLGSPCDLQIKRNKTCKPKKFWGSNHNGLDWWCRNDWATMVHIFTIVFFILYCLIIFTLQKKTRKSPHKKNTNTPRKPCQQSPASIVWRRGKSLTDAWEGNIWWKIQTKQHTEPHKLRKESPSWRPPAAVEEGDPNSSGKVTAGWEEGTGWTSSVDPFEMTTSNGGRLWEGFRGWKTKPGCWLAPNQPLDEPA